MLRFGSCRALLGFDHAPAGKQTSARTMRPTDSCRVSEQAGMLCGDDPAARFFLSLGFGVLGPMPRWRMHPAWLCRQAMASYVDERGGLGFRV